MRLQHLQTWISTWALPSIFGGIQGVGSSEAWYATAVDVEWAMTHNIPIIGGTLDLYKCFDQILRPLLYVVLRLSGFPECVLTAYINFQENMHIHNTVHGSIGKPHQHPAGIPQGCPFSMVFIALLLRPWTVQVQELGGIARTMADDLLLLVRGSRALHGFHHIFHLTMVHLHDLGAKKLC